MADRFVIPQFIDEEAKIIGPITGRQFMILLVAGMFEFIFFKLFDFALFLTTGIPLIFFAIVLAFVKVRGQRFHYFILNFFQTMRKPGIRVWMKGKDDTIQPPKPTKKEKREAELQAQRAQIVEKKPASKSRLSDLSLVVNTGGVYRPDDQQ